MKEQSRELWKICFPDDSDEFVELYFSRRYTDDINTAVFRDGRMVSVLQRIPYNMKYYNKVIPVSYISGACTHPGYRSGGLMSVALTEAHRTMYHGEKLISVLIPASEGLINYYSRFGYSVCFQQEEKLLTASSETVDNFIPSLIINRIDLCKNLDYELFDFINRQLSTKSVSILHDYEDLGVIMTDHALSGGDVLVFRDKGNIIMSVAFVIPSEDKPVIKELLVSSLDIMQQVISLILDYYGVSSAVHTKPCGMSRVINAHKMLELYSSHTNCRCVIEVHGDSDIESNNGIYILRDGKCIKTDEELPACGVIHMDIHQLSSFLFSGTVPHMSLMLD